MNSFDWVKYEKAAQFFRDWLSKMKELIPVVHGSEVEEKYLKGLAALSRLTDLKKYHEAREKELIEWAEHWQTTAALLQYKFGGNKETIITPLEVQLFSDNAKPHLVVHVVDGETRVKLLSVDEYAQLRDNERDAIKDHDVITQGAKNETGDGV